MSEKLDASDVTILRLLQRDARIGLEALAEEAGLSVASVQRRVKSLRARKVITGDVALVDPAKVGMPMTFVVMVELERERLDQIRSEERRVGKEC